MNSYSQSLKSLNRMDRNTQIAALDFQEYLVSRPYYAFDRKVSEEEFDKHLKIKKKEIQWLKNKLKIKC